MRSCYEAGRDGFWVHHFLEQLGIRNLVIDSSSIEVNRRLRRAKSDKLDAASLVGLLIRYREGETKVLSTVVVPDVEDEDNRHVHRELNQLLSNAALSNSVGGVAMRVRRGLSDAAFQRGLSHSFASS